VLWRALHDLAVAAAPALAFTAEEVWQHHPGLLARGESVHLAEWPAGSPAADEGEWEFLLAARDAVNAAIEPLRATKELATTLEAEVAIAATDEAVLRLAPYRDELAGFLLVAGVTVRGGRAADSDVPFAVTVKKTAHRKCERCWTYRPEVDDAGLCARCVAALAARTAG
jgi:isoleucyl-tRNA synthetase